MQRDSYPVLMQILVATAIIGLAVKYGDLYLFHVVLGIVLFRSLFVTKPGTLFGRSHLGSKYDLLFPFMLLWFALGLAWSWDRTATLRYLAYVAIGGSLSVLIVKYIGTSRARFEELFAVARNLFLLDVGIGLLEALTPFRLPVSPLYANNDHWQKLTDLTSEQIATLTQCPTGFHWNTNNYSTVMLILLPFFLFHRRLMVRIVGPLVIGTLLYFASSRGCIAAMAFVLSLVPVYQSHRTRWILASLILAICSYAYLSGALQTLDRTDNPKVRSLAGIVEAVYAYVSPEGAERGSSVSVRRELIANGLEALHRTRGLGVGGGAAEFVQQQHGREVARLGSMHNFWIELLVNGGYPLFLPFVVWYGKLAYELHGHRQRFRADPKLAYYTGALSLALVGFIPGAISPSSTVYVLPMYILFGMAIAMVNICRQQVAAGVTNRPSVRARPLPAFVVEQSRRKGRFRARRGTEVRNKASIPCHGRIRRSRGRQAYPSC